MKRRRDYLITAIICATAWVVLDIADYLLGRTTTLVLSLTVAVGLGAAALLRKS